MKYIHKKALFIAVLKAVVEKEVSMLVQVRAYTSPIWYTY